MGDVAITWAQAFKHAIDTYLDRLGIVVGLILAVLIFGNWREFTIGRRRRERRLLQDIRRRPGKWPGSLILQLLLGRSMRPAVKQYPPADPASRRALRRVFS